MTHYFRKEPKMKATVKKFYDGIHLYIWIIIAPASYFATATFFLTGL